VKARKLDVKKTDWPLLSQQLAFTVGKGGVGKTTVSASIAYLERKHTKQPVTICSTDPAPSLDDVFQTEVTDEAQPVLGDRGLQAIEVDSVAEFREWADEMQSKIAGAFAQLRGGVQIDVSFDRQIFTALLDIVPPGVDEIFAIFKILDLAASARQHLVIDMAPTGHALELLRMPERIAQWSRLLLKTLAAHRTLALAQDVAVEIATIGQRVRALRSMMQDARRSCAIAVMLPEPLPEHQTEYLLQQLSGLKIEVAAVMVNRVVMGETRCPRCASTQTWQRKTLDRLGKTRARRGGRKLYLLAEQPQEVAGREALERFTGHLYRLK
jgi:arsenite-transporting ATPase